MSLRVAYGLTLLLLCTLCTLYAPEKSAEARKLQTPTYYTEGPCKAIHYGRPGHKKEISMDSVVANRQDCPGRHCIGGFEPRPDVSGFMTVRNIDRWRIAQNWRALVVFRYTDGRLTAPIWIQPADYQKASDMTSNACRVEVSEEQAAAMGWSLWQGWGRTTAYIIRWER